MLFNLIGAVVAAVMGGLVAFLNYIMSKTVLEKVPDKYAFTMIVRQVLQIGFLVVAYFIGSKIESINLVYILVGAVLGLTLPMMIFTKKLLAFNNNLNEKRKGASDDG